MTVASKLLGVLDRQIPLELLADTNLRRQGRILCGAVLFIVTTSVPRMLALAWMREWLWLSMSVAFTLAQSGALLLLRRGRLDAALNTLLGAVMVMLFCTTLMHREFDWTIISWLSVVPMFVLVYQPKQSSARWALMVAALTVASLGFHAMGWRLDTPYANFHVAQGVRVISNAILFYLLVLISMQDRAHAESELARARDEAEAANKAKGMFLAVMSHELRTPMNGVLGIAELLQHTTLDDDQRQKVELIHRSGSGLIALINDVLDYSKGEARRIELVREPFDLRHLLADLAGLLEPRAKEKDVSLSIAQPDGESAVLGDSFRLRQVLTNLLGNALKFTERGAVDLKVARVGERLRFAVSDSGIGMDEHHLGKLFVPFSQAAASSSRRFGGTGLGLAISRNLVELMGGDIAVSSALGRGSEFSFEIDLPRTQPSIGRGSPRPESHPARPKSPVLVVDDNATNRLVAGAMIAREGFSVVYAPDGAEALALIEARDFSLVFMDCHMPMMDGFEAVSRVRELPSHRRATRVVALTASASREEFDACLQAGMDRCFAKPVTAASIRLALAEASDLRPSEAGRRRPTIPGPRASSHPAEERP